ncbi:MAG: xanthine dehydrogenase molybdopterin binding subunit [Rhizobiales bacterium]|nr:xanthine dehydrogenase molybdopterin binding subunit [Hyphomicrobiales bacterium]
MNKVIKHSVVGKSIAHESAQYHVAGNATYIDDILEPSGTLHIAAGFSNIARGDIKKLELSAVENAKGVVRVLTAKDVKGVNDWSPSIGGDPIFVETEIVFHGQVLFAVIANTRDNARKAARLAKVETSQNKPMVTIADGKKAGAEVLAPFTFEKGSKKCSVAKTIANSKHKIRGNISIGGQEHFYLEGQICLAVPGEGGAMHVYSSTQHPTEVQHLIAKMLLLPEALVVCENRRMGGAFGGKESQAAQWACIAALGASLTNKPCKMRLDRDDDMISTGKRHDFVVDYFAGFNRKGVLTGVDVNFAARCGYSADLSLGVNDRTMFHADNSYFYPSYKIHSERVKTNTVSNTAFRGFGGPQGMVFAERMMDQIAIELDEDPLEIRRRNFYRKGKSTTPYGMKVTDNIINEIVDELERTSKYQKRRKEIDSFNAKNRFLKKGIALNPVKFGIAFTLKHLNQAGALVHVYTDGSILINHGGTEMGQGLHLKVAQVVAEEFGVDVSVVRPTATTTEKVPNTTPTAASSGSDLNGMAAKNAATKIKKRMIAVVSKKYKVKPKSITFENGKVIFGKQKLSLAEVAKLCFLERVQLSATGFYSTPKITWERESATGNPFLYFTYGACCAEVIVDLLTGENRVTRIDILHDVGTSLNPAIDIGQIEGGFVQGMGWLTTEELVFDDKGVLKTHAPSTYKIPTCSDVPQDFRVNLYKSTGNKEKTIYRSKAVGEPPVMLATAVFSAITHAVASLKKGVVPALNAPATPEAIMRAVTAMNVKI